MEIWCIEARDAEADLRVWVGLLHGGVSADGELRVVGGGVLAVVEAAVPLVPHFPVVNVLVVTPDNRFHVLRPFVEE